MKENRQPVVVIMGHIDHGKSTLLDYIRTANTTSKEVGGITQHVAAYEADGITFIDTPGHAAFSTIRERGSNIADIAILIVSAEEGVKPQTIEAINLIKKSGLPFIVAINKIDKPNANPDKVKTELADADVLVEGWGGKISCIPISAKTGEGVKDLIETIKLQAEIDELSYDSKNQGYGFIIESKRDSKRGISTTLIVKDGSIKKGDFIQSGKQSSPIRILENTEGYQVEKVTAGKPAVLVGWNEIPQVGKEFKTHSSKEESDKAATNSESYKTIIETEDTSSNKKIIPIVVKADTIGSLEAITAEIKKLEIEKITLKIIAQDIGPISEADTKIGRAFPELLVIGFNVKIDQRAESIAIRDKITIKTFNIIYELIEWTKEEIEKRKPKEELEEMTGQANILKIFSINKNKQVIGGKVDEGTIETNAQIKIIRRETEIGEGFIRELQSKKTKTGKIEVGNEFGALIESKTEIAVGDKILCVKRVIK